MDALSTLALVVIAVASAIAVAFLVPALIEFRRAAQRFEGFVHLAELELKPAVDELREAIRNVNKASEGLQGGMVKVSGTLEAIHQVGMTLRATNEIVRATLSPKLIGLASAVVGVRKGLGVLFTRLLKRR